MEFPFFHGKITRRTCEELLGKKKKNGSYLIRESESMEGALCLCVLFEDLIYTYRIYREHQGYFRIQWFCLSMKDTISHEEEWFVDKNIVFWTLATPLELCCHSYHQTSEGVPDRIFKTLKDLIYTFEKPNQGLITNLRYPVKKSKASQRSQRFKSGTDSVYAEVDDSGDYITVLP